MSATLGAPWIADLQDPLLEGIAHPLLKLAVSWRMRSVLRSAHRVVQVSPEWADTDARILGRNVEVLRHAIPVLPSASEPRAREADGVCRVLYAGLADPAGQDPAAVMDAIAATNAAASTPGRRLELRVASTREVHSLFARRGDPSAHGDLVHLGWLSADRLSEEMQRADVLLLLNWSQPNRPTVPSKLYEYLAYGKPVLLAGRDSGGVRRLQRELGHPDVIADTGAKLRHALAGVLRGDPSGLFQAARCRVRPVDEIGLGQQYLAWADAAVLGARP